MIEQKEKGVLFFFLLKVLGNFSRVNFSPHVFLNTNYKILVEEKLVIRTRS